jgi:hypothetical protein
VPRSLGPIQVDLVDSDTLAYSRRAFTRMPQMAGVRMTTLETSLFTMVLTSIGMKTVHAARGHQAEASRIELGTNHRCRQSPCRMNPNAKSSIARNAAIKAALTVKVNR